MSIWKVHHGIQKSTALQDYNKVKELCEKAGKPVAVPSGKHWHRVEDATGEMVRSLTIKEQDSLDLNRGVDYYCDLQNLHNSK